MNSERLNNFLQAAYDLLVKALLCNIRAHGFSDDHRDRIYPAAIRAAESKGTAVVNSSSHLIKKLFFDAESIFFTPIFTDIIQKLVMWQRINLCAGCNTIWASKQHRIKPFWALFGLKTYFSPASMKK
jgi:hypothetical protein